MTTPTPRPRLYVKWVPLYGREQAQLADLADWLNVDDGERVGEGWG
jgi:hypothetical protein